MEGALAAGHILDGCTPVQRTVIQDASGSPIHVDTLEEVYCMTRARIVEGLRSELPAGTMLMDHDCEQVDLMGRSPAEDHVQAVRFRRRPAVPASLRQRSSHRDAAHPLLPFTSQGVSAALEDAVILADCLAGDGRDALAGILAAFVRTRRRRLGAFIEGGRRILSSFLDSGGRFVPPYVHGAAVG